MTIPSAGARSFISRLALAALIGLAAAPSAPAAAAMRVERVAFLMRHGVRPPTKSPPMPAGTASEAWPGWEARPGDLTAHGARAIALVGKADRAALAVDGLLPATGCPAAGAVSLVSDSDQRTIATGDAWAAGFAPGCTIANRHHAQDDPDPVFSAIEMGVVDYDPKQADAAIVAGLPAGGIAALDGRARAHIDRLNAILCGSTATVCGLPKGASGVAAAQPHKRPSLTGPLDRGSTAAQILLLEYTEGKPLAEVGWGRATTADVTALGSLHATEFRVVARPPYVAARNVAPIAALLRDGLAAPMPGAPKVTMIVGHDTNIANLGGLLDLHWQAPGFATDDPAPGGALVMTLLRDTAGARFVRVAYRAQPLDSIRSLKPGTTSVTIDVPGCGTRADHLCPAATFVRLIGAAADLVKAPAGTAR